MLLFLKWKATNTIHKSDEITFHKSDKIPCQNWHFYKGNFTDLLNIFFAQMLRDQREAFVNFFGRNVLIFWEFTVFRNTNFDQILAYLVLF